MNGRPFILNHLQSVSLDSTLKGHFIVRAVHFVTVFCQRPSANILSISSEKPSVHQAT